ncbi:DivIVA domain-containing protein [Bifidobacterium samirii]|uniref:DivIVA domain containing protein n=1 Tax=Bifidobacterium samirii TaxID=2306974 RepID=A0A430FVE0_9BIFI|nr:DivIVA domain-containing protein [Bifidobacterium samirii]RSX57745.1 DivIVA domain containing protein [Bifidobacterium samirii]
MAKEAQTERGSIARAGKRKMGYDVGQVDAFLERAHALYEDDEASLTQQDIQNVSFDLAKGGYDIAQVDAALSRLEKAVVDRQTAAQIGEHGRVAWRAQTEELYRSVAAHAERAPRTRFRDGRKRQPSYDRKQVDRLIDGIVAKAADELGMDAPVAPAARDRSGELTAAGVTARVFTQRKGARGYDERQVDFFLNACVQLLTRIESFARVSEMMQHDGDGEPHATARPLFPAADDSFDAVHEAERAIFAPSAVEATAAMTKVSVPVPPVPVAPAAPAAPATPAVASTPTTPAASVLPETIPSFAPPKPVVPAAPAAPAAPAPVAPTVAESTAGMDAEPSSVPSLAPAGDSPLAAPTMPGADSSLAQLAQLAEKTQEQAAETAPQAFRPHIPDLPSAIAPVVPDLGTSSDSALSEPPASMPASYAPERRPERTVPQGRVAQSAVPTPPTSGVDQPARIDQATRPSMFPQLDESVDTDIPDLSFPPLYGNGERK